MQIGGKTCVKHKYLFINNFTNNLLPIGEMQIGGKIFVKHLRHALAENQPWRSPLCFNPLLLCNITRLS